MGQRVKFHRELIEFGALPIAKWLGGDEGPAAVLHLLHSLLDSAVQNDQQQCEGSHASGAASMGCVQCCSLLKTVQWQWNVSADAADLVDSPTLTRCLDVSSVHVSVR